MLYNSRGISVHAFEFSSAEKLSAQHMGYLGATLRQVLTRARTGGWRCHSDVTILRDKTGAGVRVTSHTGSAQRFVEIWRKLGVEIRHWTKTVDFWSSQTQGELAPNGGRSRWGPNELDSIEDCVPPPCVETFNLKLIKRFCTWTRSRYVFSNFEIPIFYHNEHYMSISHIALIVNMVQKQLGEAPFQCKSLYVCISLKSDSPL